MLTALALAVLQVASPAPVEDSDVTVVARKLENLAIILKRRRGAYYCKYTRRSGDAELDAAACTAAIDCYRGAAKVEDFRTCVVTAVTALVTPSPRPE